MADLDDFFPIRTETVESIRARLDADVNAGHATDDPLWMDTTPGSFFYDVTQPVVMEMERLWDSISIEYPAAVFLQFAYGDYLDEFGATVNLPRNDATFATGEVTVTGTPGTVVVAGSEVGTPGGPDGDPITFEVPSGGTIGGGGTVDVAVKATASGPESNVGVGAITLLLTPTGGVTSLSNAAAILGGTDVENDDDYRERLLLRYTGTIGAGTMDSIREWALDEEGVSHATVTAEDPVPGYTRVVVTDASNDPVSQAILDALKARLDPYSASNQLNGGITLPTGTITVDSTANFQGAGMIEIGGQVVSYTGITLTTFTGCTGGTGTFGDNSPVLQSGQIAGLIPAGLRVLVQTPAGLTINVAATIVHRTGYSLDGTAGTVATRDALEKAVRAYLDELPPGEDAILNHVEAVFFGVEGVYNVSGVTLNTVAADVVVAALQVAQVGTITLT